MSNSPQQQQQQRSPSTKNMEKRISIVEEMLLSKGADYFEGEFGLVGAVQGDETHYDDRSTDDDEDGFAEGRIQFSKKKLYGRETELQRLAQVFDSVVMVVGGVNHQQHDEQTKSTTTDAIEGANASSSQQGGAAAVFLSGYSGCGKSALVHEFVRPLQNTTALISGKYDEMQASDPFSAITRALGQWCQTLSEQDVKKNLQHIQGYLQETIGPSDVSLLVDLVPDLSRLVLQARRGSVEQAIDPVSSGDEDNVSEAASLTSKSSRLSRSRCSSAVGKAAGGRRMNKTRIKYIFQCLFRSLCCSRENEGQEKQFPLVMFLDDLQWADDASLELLSSLLGDVTMTNFMFVGAYRSNEVHPDHPLTAVMNALLEQEGESKTSRTVEVMELSELASTNVREFIGDTLGLEPDEVQPLSDAVFSKTLGNPFFTMQAMEQLVRKNALYYDTMIFSWQWNLSKDQLQDQLSDDIIEMVKSKIDHMPDALKRALVVASSIRAIFDVETLRYVMLSAYSEMEGSDNAVDRKELVGCLDQAVIEGLLLKSPSRTEEYSFAHDRIQEAARRYMDDKLLIEIANALAARGDCNEDGEDWMLFTAAHHLNSVPIHYHSADTKIKLAQLNLKTAQLSTGVAGFDQAAKSLRAGINVLDEDTRWTEQYDLMIDLYNHLLDIDFRLGNYEQLQDGIQEVLAKARTLKDKGHGLVHSVGIISISKERDHAKALQKGKEILSILGIEIMSVDIDDVTPTDIKKQEMLCNAALGDLEVKDLFNAPVMEDETTLIVLDKMAGSSVMSGRLALNYLLSKIAIRICAKQGISPYLPRIVVYECLYFQKVNPNYKQSYKMAVLCQEMLDRIPGITPESRCKVGLGIYNGGFVLQQPMQQSVEAFMECYGHAIKAGDTEWGFIAAMCYGLAFCASGSQITAVTEAKFAFYEEECRRFSQPPSVSVVFSIMRQFCLGLQGKSANPCVFDGRAMKEEAALGNFDPESTTYKQTLRDMSSFKMMTSCIFRDLSTMEDMIRTLRTWPDFDILVCRGYIRLLWVTFGCFELARAGKGKCFLALGRKHIKWFRSGAKKGNPNDNVALQCLLAENKQTKKNYDIAINGCSDLGMLHMEALMNERCGLCQMERKKQMHAEAYLTKAVGLYNKWGATAKVAQMKRDHSFLHNWRAEP